jgi:hypothetical protein
MCGFSADPAEFQRVETENSTFERVSKGSARERSAGAWNLQMGSCAERRTHKGDYSINHTRQKTSAANQSAQTRRKSRNFGSAAVVDNVFVNLVL